MTKIVINRCYGGFSLSDEATREYLRRTGRQWTEGEPSVFGSVHFEVVGEPAWYMRDIERTDPVLVAIVEEWGDAANGLCAALKVVDLPAGTRYRISEYDGFETLERADEVDWSVA